MWGRQSQKSFIVYLKGALLYIIGFVKSLGWKVVSCHERSLASGIFMGLLPLFQTHLREFLPRWRCPCQGFLLWTLGSTLGCHNRNPWPGCFVPSSIHNYTISVLFIGTLWPGNCKRLPQYGGIFEMKPPNGWRSRPFHWPNSLKFHT
jgi:hypothetical protein